MRKFLAKFWQIKFNNIQKKVIIQHGQVRFIQKHKLGLTFEKINQYNLPYWDERRKKHDYLKRYRKSTGQISASIHVKIISINIRRKIPGHPWKHGGITVSGPSKVETMCFLSGLYWTLLVRCFAHYYLSAWCAGRDFCLISAGTNVLFWG